MKRLMSALAYPLLILAGLLLYQVFTAGRGDKPPIEGWPRLLQLLLAIVLAALGFTGLRMRHQHDFRRPESEAERREREDHERR